jgi:hypothetical protein
LLNEGILNQFKVNFEANAPDEYERSYLTHPDLHSSNVLLDKKTFRVNGIIDWEGCCTLPVANWLVPLPALVSCPKHQLYPGSLELVKFGSRASRHTEILVDQLRKMGLDCGARKSPLANPKLSDFTANILTIPVALTT